MSEIDRAIKGLGMKLTEVKEAFVIEEISRFPKEEIRLRLKSNEEAVEEYREALLKDIEELEKQREWDVLKEIKQLLKKEEK